MKLPLRLLVSGVVLAAPATASATATVEVQKTYGFFATFEGDAAASQLTLRVDRNTDGTRTIVFHDDGTTIAAGRGCTLVDDHEAGCVAKEAGVVVNLRGGGDTLGFRAGSALWQDISASGNAGDDRLDVTGLTRRRKPSDNVEPHFYGDGGDDLLLGGPTAEALFGGAGADVLHGGDGNDDLDGGGGHDALFAENGHDGVVGDAVDAAIEGGAGDDALEVYGRGDVDVVCGPGEDDVYHGWRLEPGVIMEGDCERTLQQHPTPVATTRRRITFFVRCYDGGGECSGTLELRWRHRLVASRSFASSRFERITLPLSAALSRRMRRHTVTLAMNVRGFLYDVNDYSPSRVGNCWWRTRVRPRR